MARERFARLRIVDAVTFVRTDVLPALAARGVDVEKAGDVVVHPTCATVHLGAVDDLRAVAEAAAERATVPAAWGCCGFAGDRGMLHPELTAGATRAESAEVAQQGVALPGGAFDAYVSNNRTCEMGMSRATGHDYVHVLELLEAATRHRREVERRSREGEPWSRRENLAQPSVEPGIASRRGSAARVFAAVLPDVRPSMNFRLLIDTRQKPRRMTTGW